jgi:hypothetical protein
MKKYNSETYGKINREVNPEWMGWLIIDKQKQKSDFPGNLKSEEILLNDLEYSFFNKK